MSIQEQSQIRERYYVEAMRYIDNAKECLKKAKKEDGIYGDSKYVRMACGTAYSGVLIALDGFFILKGIEPPVKKLKKSRKSIEYYLMNVGKLDGKLLDYVNMAYQILHLSGYYDGVQDARVVSAGFEHAGRIIDRIKPAC